MNDEMWAKGMSYLVAAFADHYPVRVNTLKKAPELWDGISGELFVKACLKIAQTYPQLRRSDNIIALIRRECRGAPSTADAWLEIQNAMKIGDYSNWTHPAVKQTVAALGIWNLRNCKLDQFNVMRGQALRLYEKFVSEPSFENEAKMLDAASTTPLKQLT